MFLIFEGGITIGTLVGIIAGSLSIIITARSKLVKEYFSSSKGLLENTKGLLENAKAELDLAKAKAVKAELDLQEMKAENKTLHREIAQRIEIHLEDQDTIRSLKNKNG